jgi:hypothetical protein
VLLPHQAHSTVPHRSLLARPVAGFFAAFNRGFEWLSNRFGQLTSRLIRASVVVANAKTPRAPWEIEAWSAYMEKRGPDSDAETLSGFAEYVGQHSKTREDIKT